MLQKVSLFHEMFHCFAISPFAKHFASFVSQINRNTKNRNVLEKAAIFVCFAVSRNRIQPFRQKPSSGSMKSTAVSHFSYCICEMLRIFAVLRNRCEPSETFRESPLVPHVSQFHETAVHCIVKNLGGSGLSLATGE